MSDPDDPFGLDQDAGRTRIRPRSSGARPRPTPARIATGAPVHDVRANDNPLVASFASLLGLAPELERATQPENPDLLWARLLETLTVSRDAAVSKGVPLSRADQATWFVGALLDDIAINTPWGGGSAWPRRPLVAEMYGNVDSGERFYHLAEDLLRYPERDPELLELVFLCLSLGFRGKHRIGGGEAAIAQLRGQMARTLRDRDAADAPLAPHWKGVAAEDEDRGFILPLWSIALVAMALVTAIYVGLGLMLSNRGERLYTLAQVLPPPERAEIFRPLIETEDDEIVLTTEPFIFEILPLFAAAAPPGLVDALSGREDVSLAVLAIQGSAPEVFRSAQSALNADYAPLLGSVADVIVDNAELIGAVRVVGHTDSVAVQRSNPFRSNQGLSEARAQTIADMLVAAGVPAGLVSAQGKAATDPIADNGTSEGRARNRRVEIIVQKKV